MNTFPQFPTECVCPLCGTNEDKECILVPVVNSSDGPQPMHTACLNNYSTFAWDKKQKRLFRSTK